MHSKQTVFTYNDCGRFTKYKERTKRFNETRDSKYIYQNELDKACFQHDKTYEDLKDLNRRTASDNLLRDKAFNVAKNLRYDGYQRGLASMI